METVSMPFLNEHLERVTVGDVNICKHMLPQPQRSLKVSYILKNNFDIDCVTVQNVWNTHGVFHQFGLNQFS